MTRCFSLLTPIRERWAVANCWPGTTPTSRTEHLLSQVIPGIFPHYVTGAITASGGAWNASIVSEAVSWGSTKLSASGLGAYIAQMTEAGDYPRIALGIAVMSALVISLNRLLWRPLYAFAARRTRLD